MGEDTLSQEQKVDPQFSFFCLEMESVRTTYLRDSLPHYIPVIESGGTYRVMAGRAVKGEMFLLAFTSPRYLQESPLLVDASQYRVVQLSTPKKALAFWSKLVKTLVSSGEIVLTEECKHSIGLVFNYSGRGLQTNLVSACLTCYVDYLSKVVKDTPEPKSLYPEEEGTNNKTEITEIETYPVDNSNKPSEEETKES